MFMEVLVVAVVVEMQNVASDMRCSAVENPDYVLVEPEMGLEVEFRDEEVEEASKEREALKERSKEVDESM
ncbi:hypothetical protein PAXRUDRAFT_19308 [Paxillus rubicundulus Ve08.2h10]|uniref:Unplaced genomic scaffold scaffold_3551, whole genome shotgun sequence n=1 Tax=Paxillus rubicundulus Ve08.2h10 TaxID=930991 RepID=A0A0D0CIQ8_9AGAM|nr:hypothetical protein PAXRUDRAFT_19308 [Paxillus rubicundulus Ve08.2h10]